MAIYIRESRKEDDPEDKILSNESYDDLYATSTLPADQVFLVSTHAWAESSYLTNQYLFLAQDDRNYVKGCNVLQEVFFLDNLGGTHLLKTVGI